MATRKQEPTDRQAEQTQQTAETAAEQQTQEAETVQAEQAQQVPENEQLAKQLKEEQDRHLRLMAEFDNFRRRTQKERGSIYTDAVADTVKELLPVLDNFERALEAGCADEEYKKGVQMTYGGFSDVLKKLGLCEFGEAGEAFDPLQHNAVMHIEDEALGKNVVSQVFQRGYRIGDKVLRYAMVQTAN